MIPVPPQVESRRPSLGVLIVPDVPVDQVVERARHAEAVGVDTVWVADEKFFRDPFVTLGAIAERTERIGLATCVTEPYARHPALIAMAMGTLHERAPGRVLIGMGAGGSGFPPMGVERRAPATALREATTIIRGLLAGEEVDVDGKVISFRNGKLNFDAAPLPIFLAGRGPKVLQTAGEVGDGVILAPFASPVTLGGAAEQVARGVERREGGERPPLIARVDVSISDDPAAARDAVRWFVALPIWSSFPNLGYLEPTGVTLPDEVVEMMATRRYDQIARAAPLLPTELIDHFSLAGTRAEVSARLQQIATVVDGILINPIASADTDVDEVIAVVAEERDRLFPRPQN